MKLFKIIIVLLVIGLVAQLVFGCNKPDISKDIIYQTDTLIRHEVISYELIKSNLGSSITNVKFKWSNGAIDSINITPSIRYMTYMDKPTLNIFYTYRRYRDGTYNYTMIEPPLKPIAIYFPID